MDQVLQGHAGPPERVRGARMRNRRLVHVVSPGEWANADSDGDLHGRLRAIVMGRSDVMLAESAAHADLCIAFERWKFRPASAVGEYLRDEWLSQNIEKLYVINQDDVARGFLAGCYVSLRPRQYDPRLHVPCAYAWTYNRATSGVQAVREPSLLFSFRGTDTSHPLRRRVTARLQGEARGRVTIERQAFHTHNEAQKIAFVQEMLDSKFVLCPRGWSPCTYRLFEAMSLGRCPVIISDDWIPIPGVRWEQCSLRVPESEINQLPEILHHWEADAAKLGKAAGLAWREHFDEDRRFHGFLDAILKLDAMRTAQTRSRSAHYQRWRSWPFNWANGWTAPQRVMRRLHAVATNMLRWR